ncbi:MAG: sulfotransferase domain-containing protein [Geminicoccaceae bacterium]|nr:sulfotransferase domain-containing protein [Geminicoccaceae bacterium]
MSHVLWSRLVREAVARGAFFVPAPRRLRLERYLRGKEEAEKLRRADAAVVSFGKSGRTWLRVLLSRFYQQRFALPDGSLFGFDNLHRKNGAVPRLLFTHDNYLKDYTGHGETKDDYLGTKVVLLVRDPRDTAVSQFFQWKFRMRPAKKALNDYPAHGADMPINDFLFDEGGGLPKVIGFLNGWAGERERFADLLVVRYEDLRRDTGGELARVLRFLGIDPTPTEVEDCVRYASVENMRTLETKRVFWLAGTRMRAKDEGNPDSFKVRRAKVGGWRDYLSEDEAARVEALIAATLLPGFGYRPDEAPPARASA